MRTFNGVLQNMDLTPKQLICRPYPDIESPDIDSTHIESPEMNFSLRIEK